MAASKDENIFYNLYHLLNLLKEINNGQRVRIQELSDLTANPDQPEVISELTEAILFSIVQAEATEYRWRSKLESISTAGIGESETPPPRASKLLIWKNEKSELIVDLRKAVFIPKIANLVKTLLKEIERQLEESNRDLFVTLKLERDMVPELMDMGIKYVEIYARSDLASKLKHSIDDIEENLFVILHSFQLPFWGGEEIMDQVIGEGSAIETEEVFKVTKDTPALLFPFHHYSKPGSASYYCFVEFVAPDGLIRLTLDNPKPPTLNVDLIPHILVKEIDKRIHLKDLKYVANAVFFEILRAKDKAVRQLGYHFGSQKDYGIFQELQNAGFSHVNTIMFYWSSKTEQYFARETVEQSVAQIGRILLALEKKTLIEQLLSGRRLEVCFAEGRSAFLDMSMRGQWLNISFDERRNASTTSHYLNRMPNLRALAEQKIGIARTDILLIHHLTPEILAMIKELDQEGCNSLHVLFVRYNPNIPSSYREALLLHPNERFHFMTIQKNSEGEFIKDFFTLSEQFSPLRDWQPLKKLLEKEKLDFFEAMRLCAGQIFFKKCFNSLQQGTSLLLIEDGGYLAPYLNQLCLEERTVEEALKYYAFSEEQIQQFSKQTNLSTPLYTWLEPFFIGSVEHTRNGYDALEAIEKQFNQLAFPACSIAISDLKRFKEGDEVATSIIHAVESMLHILGFVISQRDALILGSRGTIGKPLLLHLRERITGLVFGVDLQVDEKQSDTHKGVVEASTIDALPLQALQESSLIIGVIGRSILKQEHLVQLMLQNKNPQLFFASGSTKKVEFSDALKVLQQLQMSEAPSIGGIPVILEETEIRDPGTFGYLGRCLRISAPREYADKLPRQKQSTHYFLTPAPEGYVFWKEIFLLGDLMPINFFYSGVPTEIIDLVLTQLMQVSLRFVEHYRTGKPLPAKLYAVDHEIDDQANPLSH